MLDPHIPPSSSLAGLAREARAVADATLAVLPAAAKMSLRARASAIAAAEDAFGVALPPTACRFLSKGMRSAFWLGPDEWLLQAVGEFPAELFTALESVLVGHSHALVDISHRSEAFSISGAKSEYVLNHGCPLDLSPARFPVGMCTRTLIGKATVLLWRPEIRTFRIDIGRSFAPYVWRFLDEARSELA